MNFSKKKKKVIFMGVVGVWVCFSLHSFSDHKLATIITPQPFVQLQYRLPYLSNKMSLLKSVYLANNQSVSKLQGIFQIF